MSNVTNLFLKWRSYDDTQKPIMEPCTYTQGNLVIATSKVRTKHLRKISEWLVSTDLLLDMEVRGEKNKGPDIDTCLTLMLFAPCASGAIGLGAAYKPFCSSLWILTLQLSFPCFLPRPTSFLCPVNLVLTLPSSWMHSHFCSLIHSVLPAGKLWGQSEVENRSWDPFHHDTLG